MDHLANGLARPVRGLLPSYVVLSNFLQDVFHSFRGNCILHVFSSPLALAFIGVSRIPATIHVA